MTTDRPDTDEPIVIRPAITCPADFPKLIQSFTDEVLALAPKILDLSERIGTTILPTWHAVGSGDDEQDAFDKATGYEELRLVLLHLATELLTAADAEHEWSEPSWFVPIKLEHWKMMLNDPWVDVAYKQKVQNWLDRDGPDMGRRSDYVEGLRAVEGRLRKGLRPE